VSTQASLGVILALLAGGIVVSLGTSTRKTVSGEP